jgi:transposase
MKMSAAQWKKLDVLERTSKRRLTNPEAAQILGLSERQVRRLRRRHEELGDECVIHGNSGRSPSNRLSEDVREKILELLRGKYVGFNDTHFTEKLREVEGLDVTRSTVQRVAREGGVAAARPRRPRKYRSRREREAQAGMMLLWDGSRHDWLESRGPMLCLMGAIDDATGELMPGAHFVLQECALGYLRVLEAVVREKGIPQKLYMDMHGSLKRNDDYWSLEEEMAGKQQPTQVGMALEALGITPIFALSPQAKGRVERLWGTLQDRLASEMRLLGISTLEAANEFLEGYRGEFNHRFGKPARVADSAWRGVPRGLDVGEACSFRYEATVGNDNVVSLGGVRLQIPRPIGGRSYARAEVQIYQLLSGVWRVKHKGECIAEVMAEGEARELKPRQRRKRAAASRAFREAVRKFSPPSRPRARQPTGSRAAKKKLPYNFWPNKAKQLAAKLSAERRRLRPGAY